jgi:2',3'-cyclic-nucleotide 2'-phosphodiesterase (5'-nucleotidase family)
MKSFLKGWIGRSIVIGAVFILPLSAKPKVITILHTNDMHASFIPHEATWIRSNQKPLIGGFNELSFMVDSLRHAFENTLLLDAGDVMTGNPITEYPYHGADGGALFEMMNQVGYEAWTVGNHDFDISVDNLKKLAHIANFPTVSANIQDLAGHYPVNNKPYVIIKKAGLRIGIIGLMSNDFYNLVNHKSGESIKLLPPVETMQNFVKELRAKTDLLIALTHQGVQDDSVLAMNISGLDVIVGGHSHTRLKTPRYVNNVIIVQTGSNCENLGELTLTVDKHKVISYDGKLLPLWYRADRPKTKLSHFIDSLQTVIQHDYAEVIGTLKTDWTRGNGRSESGIGDYITDAQREAVGADVGFMNSHGIRADKSAGPFTKQDLFEVLPFRNLLATFEISGKQLKDVVIYYLTQHPSIQTSGLQVEWKPAADGGIEFVKFLVSGKPVDEQKVYIAAASDYMAGTSKEYLGIEHLKTTYLDQTLFSVVEKKIRADKEISSVIEARIK